MNIEEIVKNGRNKLNPMESIFTSQTNENQKLNDEEKYESVETSLFQWNPYLLLKLMNIKN